jgi:UDP-sugar pyrophosphorylase
MLIAPMDHLSPEDKELVRMLTMELGQIHLFDGCKSAQEIDHLLAQLRTANQVLAPGGLSDYISRGKQLLIESKSGFNPFKGCQVSVPTGVELDPESDAYEEHETIGEKQVGGLCFVLVAGGLGERLGFPGIKISLPVESQTNMTYMELFARHILAFQRMGREHTKNESLELPLAIMTSVDTHAGTLHLLESHDYFGLNPRQVTLMMQGKVPCFADSEGRLAISHNDLAMKPHGHGDVHGLLLQTGLAQKWKAENRKWLFFFQDTNSLSMRSLCACLGVSVEHKYSMNSLAVPRAPGEASGGICRLQYPDGRDLTASVEYNMLGPLLAPQGGDGAGPNGNSPFPGNCNILLFELGRYVEVLEQSRGVVPEFVNPKYADSMRTCFKSPTRLECLMQDFALLLEGSEVGFCAMPRWLTFSVVKNSASEAVNKQKANQPMDCALSGEFEFFDANCRYLSIATRRAGFRMTGCGQRSEVSFGGLSHLAGPRVTLLPSFGASIHQMKLKVKGPITIVGGPKSSLVVGGEKTVIADLTLDGAFEVHNSSAVQLFVKNEGWKLEPAPADAPAAIAVRGFIVSKA